MCAAGTQCVEACHSAREYGVTIFEGPTNTNLFPSGEQNRERGVAFCKRIEQKGEDEEAGKSCSVSMSNVGAEEAGCDLKMEYVSNMPISCMNVCIMTEGIFGRELVREPTKEQPAKRPHGELTCNPGADNEPVV